MSEALGEEHPDGEALARGGIVVAGGITHEEHATLRDRAGALMELRRTERTRDEFRLAERRNRIPRGFSVRASGDGRARTLREDGYEQEIGRDRRLVPLVPAVERNDDGAPITSVETPVPREPVSGTRC